jgi:hypothetical protein
MQTTINTLNKLFLAAANSSKPDLGGLNFFAVFLILVGLVSVINPNLFWYLRIGRKVPHISPSKLYLGLLRFGGVLVIALGIYLLIYLRQY